MLSSAIPRLCAWYGPVSPSAVVDVCLSGGGWVGAGRGAARRDRAGDAPRRPVPMHQPIGQARLLLRGPFRAQLRREAWAKAEESPMGHLNPVPFFHLYALSLTLHQ
ncbi:uncharacterized protein ACA1_008740 [Acanthamoeba castellanii str. Neff]|uniref:Uncharacterized protein n=1 Tax=Acanthamoeba castellanii (strain ATCC 30010 / Neff) TaxID=1257118 RepID=L8HC76_ACACF|nr:uncharacterized protein ACA1_008740 [Acanthamoeba castellanii str. Neff]ELR23109.1 hypothetical protein ACA1_008740 [Acanthamoeba castellanii str. Neff]